MATPETADPVILHASAVSVSGRGLLIRGGTGSGKSSIALRMMALGAQLVSDDKTILTQRNAGIHMQAPEAIAGLIEARGIGLLKAQSTPAQLVAVLDLDTPETDRLPPMRQTEVLGIPLPLLHNSAWDAFPAALVQYLKHGRYR